MAGHIMTCNNGQVELVALFPDLLALFYENNIMIVVLLPLVIVARGKMCGDYRPDVASISIQVKYNC